MLLSVWKLKLLEAVEEMASITSVVEVLHVPYRRAWQRLREMEERLEIPLITTVIGRVGGEGAKLTSEARDLIPRYHRFADGLADEIQETFENVFCEDLISSDEVN